MKLLSDKSKAALQAIPHAGMPATRHALPGWSPASFLRFTCTSQQLHVQEGQAWMKAEQLSYEDGRLSVERFEGQLPMATYQQAVADAQSMSAGQTMFFLEQCTSLLSMLLSSPGPRDRQRD
ncbi:hypothetical protein [Noviherbaspirillum pedocola]|uniref:Uncharacterized protein n=1 Tax=Noviherbaspirillum pedocola TaxID=2801341 RepID=A0A934STY4_9BURK|nr:hypothetical protein [Noviherbaspirillum pedocola]MBK4736726.1 hypothetical protein [Noviherbaspirillum pedocola]